MVKIEEEAKNVNFAEIGETYVAYKFVENRGKLYIF